jgi:prepilin-type N-terminal cleavage/methylation domain-containing protein
MTFIELMIVVSILGIMAAILYPIIGSTGDEARCETLANNVAHVRSLLVVHASLGDVARSSSGYPLTIDNAWFKSGRMPEHAFCGMTMNVQIVNGPDALYFPASKTFNPAAVGAINAWYNTANGSFCALVPPMNTDAMTLDAFNQVNKASITSLNQTTQ